MSAFALMLRQQNSFRRLVEPPRCCKGGTTMFEGPFTSDRALRITMMFLLAYEHSTSSICCDRVDTSNDCLQIQRSSQHSLLHTSEIVARAWRVCPSTLISQSSDLSVVDNSSGECPKLCKVTDPISVPLEECASASFKRPWRLAQRSSE
jgi:hypothetical protein